MKIATNIYLSGYGSAQHPTDRILDGDDFAQHHFQRVALAEDL